MAGQSHVRNNSGTYVQQQFDPWRRLSVTAGVRIEDNTTFGASTNPKLGVSLRLRPDTRLRFSTGTGVKVSFRLWTCTNDGEVAEIM